MVIGAGTDYLAIIGGTGPSAAVVDAARVRQRQHAALTAGRERAIHGIDAIEGMTRRQTGDATDPRAAAAVVTEGRARFEREALAQLDALYSFALKLARSRDDAEDLVSDTVLRAFERWEQYRLGTNIRAWLFTILYHVFVSRKRRIDAREVQQPEPEDGRAPMEAIGEADPEGRFYDSFLDEEITRAIDALPDEYRAAVVLSDLHDLRYAEIATILRVPEGTVKSRLFRGRRLLQRKLAAYAIEMGYIKQAPQVA